MTPDGCPPSLDALADRFVGRVRELPQVTRVFLDVSGDSARLLTVIKAPPFERQYRDPVYDAELAVLAAFPDAQIDFGVVNESEYPAEARAALVPTSSVALYTR